MSLTLEQVTKIAKLSRLRLNEDEKVAAQHDLNKIFGWIEQLQAVNTDGIEPLTSVISAEQTSMRADEVTDGNKRDAVLANSPVPPNYGHFVVPKVVE